MKRIYSVAFAILISVALFAVLFSVSMMIEREKDERTQELLYYTRAAGSAEKLAHALDAAHTTFSSYDISSVRSASEMLYEQLSSMGLDTDRCAGLYRYLTLVDDISENSLRVIDRAETSNYYGNLFAKFFGYAHRLDDEFIPSIKNSPDYDLLDAIFEDLGAIYYDGLYSDEVSEEHFTMLKKASLLDVSEIDEIARGVFGDGAKLKRTRIRTVPEIYSYSCVNASVDISSFGGFVFRVLFDRRPSDIEVTAEEAKRAMADFLSERQMEGLVESDFYCQGDYFGVFAPVYRSDTGDILCLDATVNICVAKDSGRVVAYDAESYYKYYRTDRELPKIKIPADSKLVYIIASNGLRTLCYMQDGEYFNAESGNRETKIY